MVRKIGINDRIKQMWVFLITSVLIQLGGCVSTEELYADYSAANCKLVIEKTSDGDLRLRELLSNSLFQWEPAVYFEFDQHELADSESKRLDAAVKVLKQYPQLLISLQGLTDHKGSKSYNFSLAKRRVESVKEYLASQGISPARQIAQPFGEGFAKLGANDTQSRANNRRVELMLLDEQGRPVKRATKIMEELKL